MILIGQWYTPPMATKKLPCGPKHFSNFVSKSFKAVSKLSQSFLKVRTAIPMILGANIGTSVTNTIVSFTQVQNRDEFRRYKQPWSSG